MPLPASLSICTSTCPLPSRELPVEYFFLDLKGGGREIEEIRIDHEDLSGQDIIQWMTLVVGTCHSQLTAVHPETSTQDALSISTLENVRKEKSRG